MNAKLIILPILILALCINNGPLLSFFSVPALIVLFAVFLFFYGQSFYSFIKKCFLTLTECKLFFLFLLWIVISYFILLFIGNGFSIGRFLSATLFGYIVSMLFCYFFGAFWAYKRNTEKMIQLIVIIIYTILFFTIFEWIVFKLKISIGMNLFEGITGKSLEKMIAYKTMKTIPRLQSFFAEPSHFGWFLVCNIPIVLKIATSNFKLFVNKYLNFAAKKALIPFFYFVLFCTQSPINLIFAGIVTGIYFIVNTKIKFKKFIKYSIFVGILLSISGLILSRINLSETFIYRIIVTIQSFGNLYMLINLEPSLATRIISYVNMAIIFIKNPLLGVGWGNLSDVFVHQLMHSPLPITFELKDLLAMPKAVVNPAILYKVAAETGIIGVGIFYSSLMAIFIRAKKLVKNYSGVMQGFVEGLAFSVLCYMFLSVYDSMLYCHYFWFIFGIVGGLYLKVKNEKKDII